MPGEVFDADYHLFMPRKNRTKGASSFAMELSIRSNAARAAYERNGAGTHGKQGQAANRSQRRSTKQELQRDDWDR
jgi:hypothetical protein